MYWACQDPVGLTIAINVEKQILVKVLILNLNQQFRMELVYGIVSR